MNALILAAGYSSRMGRFKPLLELNGKPAIRHVIDTMQDAGIAEIAVVTGHQRELLLPHLTDVTELYNADYASGMFGSVQTGIRYFMERKAVCVMMTPADYPLLSVSAQQLALEDDGSIVIPTYNGEEGHPVSLPSWLFPYIMSYDGESGLRRLLAKYESKIVRIAVTNIGSVLDMDTPEDYQRLLELLTEDEGRG